MKLRVQVLRPRERAVRVEPCYWSEGRHNYVGVSQQERRATMQFMLGVSLRARWDATILIIIIVNQGMGLSMRTCNYRLVDLNLL